MKAFSKFLGVFATVAVFACTSANSGGGGAPGYSNKCQAECSNLKCTSMAGTKFDFVDTAGCTMNCTALTQGLKITCAECVIHQTSASTDANGQCTVFAIGKTTDPTCQVACGTGNGG